MSVSFETGSKLLIEINSNVPTEVGVGQTLPVGVLNLLLYQLIDSEQNKWSIVATMEGLSRAMGSGVSLRIMKLNKELESLEIGVNETKQSAFFPELTIKGH